MLNKIKFLLVILFSFKQIVYAQYSIFTEESLDSCTSVFERKVSENRKILMCKHHCDVSNSYSVELEELNNTKTYFRSGVSTWFYDSNFLKVRKRSTFWRGDEYGIVQEFYENGFLKLDGVCKTIKYFPKYKGNIRIMCKVDLMDTTFLIDSPNLMDSIDALKKYCYADSYTLKPTIKYVKRNTMPYPTLIQKFGEWKYYNNIGKLIRREYYSKGVLSNTIIY